jgi:hypothetical protein
MQEKNLDIKAANRSFENVMKVRYMGMTQIKITFMKKHLDLRGVR